MPKVDVGQTTTIPTTSGNLQMANVISPATVRAQGTVTPAQETDWGADIAKGAGKLLDFSMDILDKTKAAELHAKEKAEARAWEQQKIDMENARKEAQGQSASELFSRSVSLATEVITNPDNSSKTVEALRLEAINSIAKEMNSDRYRNMTVEQKMAVTSNLNTQFDDILVAKSNWINGGTGLIQVNPITGQTKFSGDVTATQQFYLKKHFEENPSDYTYVASSKTPEEAQMRQNEIAAKVTERTQKDMALDLQTKTASLVGQQLSNSKVARDNALETLNGRIYSELFGGSSQTGVSFSGLVDLSSKRIRNGETTPEFEVSSLRSQLRKMYYSNPVLLEGLSKRGVTNADVDKQLNQAIDTMSSYLTSIDPKKVTEDQASYEKAKTDIMFNAIVQQLPPNVMTPAAIAKVTNSQIVMAAFTGETLQATKNIAAKHYANKLAESELKSLAREIAPEEVGNVRKNVVNIIKNLSSSDPTDVNDLDIYGQLKYLLSYKRNADFNRLTPPARQKIDSQLLYLKQRLERTAEGRVAAEDIFGEPN